MMSKAHALLKLQNIELDILRVIAAFCSSHNIRWWLDGGTCLGAMCHRWFIPWDDDIDIRMMRSDYDRFCSLAEGGLPDGYSLHTSRNATGYAAVFAKVYRDGTRFENQENREASSSMGFLSTFFHVISSIQIDAFVQSKFELHQLHRKEPIFTTLLLLLSHMYEFLADLKKIGCFAIHSVEWLVSRDAYCYQDLFDTCIVDSNKAAVSDRCLTLS